MAKYDLTGRRFGKLTVLSLACSKKGMRRWHCVCECGTRTTPQTGNLMSGHTTSCGCAVIEMLSRRAIHGLSGTLIYSAWHVMLDRCSNPNNKEYPRYGGRGIKVCERWRKFENFIADMGQRPPGGTLERKNNDMNYGPGNCVWASKRDQARNRRNTVRVPVNGVMTPLISIVPAGMKYSTLYRRFKRGWPIERLFDQS